MASLHYLVGTLLFCVNFIIFVQYEIVLAALINFNVSLSIDIDGEAEGWARLFRAHKNAPYLEKKREKSFTEGKKRLALRCQGERKPNLPP